MLFAELGRVWAELTATDGRYETEKIVLRGYECLAYKHAPATLRDVWLTSAAAFADRDYMVFRDERLTYAEALRSSERIGAWLQSIGVVQGDRVAIAMRNYPEWMLIYWACIACGVTVCGFNSWWSSTEMGAAYHEVRPMVTFVDAERLERLDKVRAANAEDVIVVVRGDVGSSPLAITWRDVLAHEGRPRLPSIVPDDDACIFYTSGTSGTPKGAVLSHRNCITNILNVLFIAEVQNAAMARANGTEAAAPSFQPVVLVTTPLFHVTANNCGVQVATVLGGTVVLMYKWDAETAIDLIEREQVTMMSGTPVMHREVVTHARFLTADLSSLAAFSGGGASLPPDILTRIESSSLSARVSSGYGMTEAAGVIASISGDFFVAKPTSCGRLLPSFEARCIDKAGHEAAAGQAGELLVRGASVIRGYFGEHDATASSISNGWLLTGDVVVIDSDGFVDIVDRKKDMILRGGENISCVEVESLLYSYAGVAECAVFAMPDERLGEVVGAAIYPRAEAIVTAETLRAYCAERIAAFKVPEKIWILENPIPRNASGKLLKRQLSAELLRNPC